MPKYTSWTSGSGITQRTIYSVEPDLDNPSDVRRTVDALKRMQDGLSKPWGRHARLIAAVRSEWEEINASLPLDPSERNKRFVPHESAEWYTLQIVRYAKLIEGFSKDWKAISLAIEIGQLLTEQAYKQDLEKAALAGQTLLEAQGKGARSRRRHPRAERKALVEAKLKDGLGVREAMREVAEELGISYSAVSKDYYAQKSVPTLIE